MSDVKEIMPQGSGSLNEKETTSGSLSRRDFVRRSAGYALGLAGLTAGAVAASGEAPSGVEYIVIGSGPGGGPLAVNLARAGHKVVLMEAGPLGVDPDLAALISVPLFNLFVSADPRVAWDFFVQHYSDPFQAQRDTKYVAAKGGIYYPRASTIGGCSAHNVLVMLYPNNSDWDFIANATADSSWSAENMRNYFVRLEQCRYIAPPPFGFQDPQRHGFDGWQPTEMTDPKLYTSEPNIKAMIQAAVNVVGPASAMDDYAQNKLDPNSWDAAKNDTEGLFSFPMSRLNGRRWGIRERIFETAAALPNNLIIKSNCLVTRVLFDGKVAVGVEYIESPNAYRASPLAKADAPEPTTKFLFARREVIVSAGTFNSPQVLKLSGIGPRDELAQLGIEPIVDLPGVGENMQDRYELGVVSQLKGPMSLLAGCAPGQPVDPCFGSFLQGQGPYTGNLSVIANVRKSDPSRANRDLVVFAAVAPFHGYYPGWQGPAISNPDQFTWLILKAHNVNRSGTVKLRSKDPRDMPEINFHYFKEGNDTGGEDLAALVNGIQLARKFNGQLGDILKTELIPGPTVQSPQDIANFITNEAWGHHASCSNKMGAKTDPMAVVDSEFNVLGVHRLRVVDASVFPRIPGYYVTLPIMMISEKASDVILASARGRHGRR
jgi:choline dehydrogenase-like flavoprotein